MTTLQYCGLLEAFDPAAAPNAPAKKSAYSLRTATVDDIPRICDIESSASGRFGSIPELADLAQGEELQAMTLKAQQWLAVGRIYVADHHAQIAGFIAAHPMDDALYVAEISTHADHQRKGVGGMLLDAVFQWALVRAMHDGTRVARVSLITYAEVPWNGPWYGKRGFQEVNAKSVGPWHVQKMTKDEEERNLVRPGYRRCCMLWEANAPPTM